MSFLLTAMNIGCGYGYAIVARSTRIMLLLRLFEWLVVVLLLMSSASATDAATGALPWPTYDYATPLLQPQRLNQPFDDFVEDFNTFGNGNSLNGNGNAPAAQISRGKFVDLNSLKAASPGHDVEFPADDGRQRLWQWLLPRHYQQRIASQKPQQWHKQQPESVLDATNNQPHPTQLLIFGKRLQGDSAFHKRAEDFWQQGDELSSFETDALDGIDDQNADVNVNEMDDSDEQRSDILKTVKRNPTTKNETENYVNWLEKQMKIKKRTKDMAGGFEEYNLYNTWRRNKMGSGQHTFLPSISAGAMTHLGNFFKDLSNNVHYSEKAQLGHEQAKLLEGNHPLRLLHEKVAGEHAANAANADFLHALRTYRPSQKIRSLVSMNPRGYHGAQFIDPNYMWVGLGK